MSAHHKRSSYLTTSVASANALESKQSKQALYLHQALLHVLFCCSALKLMFPDQGHSIAVPFLGSCPLRTDPALLPCSFQSIISFHCISGGLPRTQAPSCNWKPFLCSPPSSSKHHEAAAALRDGAFPVLSLSNAVAVGPCSVSLKREFIKSLDMQMLCENRQYPVCSGKKSCEGFAYSNNVPFQGLTKILKSCDLENVDRFS